MAGEKISTGRAVWALLCLAAAAGEAPAAETIADLELVLAVDASGSVDDAEFVLQLDGIAYALRDARVRHAIGSGPNRRIAVNLLIWAEHNVPKDQSGWFVLADAGDAERFAKVVESYPRRVNGATGMGEGLAVALRSLEGNAVVAPRQVVDVSGDGRETPARDYVVMMPQARAMAIARGVTVNGLAILGSEDGLEDWYRTWVLAGDNTFLELAQGYESFAEAMRRKLLREIEHRPRLAIDDRRRQ